MSQDDESKRDAGDEELDALLADALTRRGDLPPTTEAEVRAAEDEGVLFEGELPPELATLSERVKAPIASTEALGSAASQRVVSIDELRRARNEKRSSAVAYVATFALGVAVAAGVSLFVRGPGSTSMRPEPGGGPAGSSVTSAVPLPGKPSIPAVMHCKAECCAGSSCAQAQGELRACASGRACVACGEAVAGNAYRIRVGNLQPTHGLDGAKLAELDLCGRTAGGEWSCVPAHADPGDRPEARSFAKLFSPADLAAGLELELRPHEGKGVIGHFRDSVRLGPTVLCRGVGALLVDEKDAHLGSLALYLDDTHYVEMARSGDALGLLDRRSRLEFADVIPSLVETTQPGAATSVAHFALTVGPLDKATAERLRWELLERGQAATVVLGADYVGAPKPLP